METAVSAIDPAVEFRDYVSEEGRYLFSLAGPDATGRIRGAWVGVDEPYVGYVVRSFGQDTDTIQVEHRGQTLTLPLKLSRVQLLRAPEGPVGVVESAAGGDRDSRLEVVTDEIRRRRVLRQANVENYEPDQT